MATIDDVAREAGVAISTVSYALSGKRKVSAETRERIAAACLALDYAPRASARALAANRSEVIAVTAPLHPDTDPSAHMAFAMEVTIAARAHDYDTLLLVHDDAQQGMRRSAATALADGIIVLDVAAHDERATLARKLTCPVVFIGVPEDTEGLVCVDLDFEAAIRQSIDTLVAAGHRSIGLIAQHRETLERESNYPLRVLHEFERYAASCGIEFAVAYPEADDSAPVLDDLFAELPNMTGIVLSTANAVAQSLQAALAARGLSVPKDVSVIAAGMTPIMARTPLPYDTLPLDPRLTCPVAVDILVDLLEGKAPARAVTLVTPVYQSQGSVAPAPVAASLQAR
jgi:DNA-binding LacI/PurR family transcriptional regulator